MDSKIIQISDKFELEKSQNNSLQKPLTSDEIQDWLVSYMAELLEVNPDKINTSIPFDRYNLNSSSAIELTGELEDLLGRELQPTLIYDYPNIEALSKKLGSSM
ncbi:hypothetical protein NUACC21_80080 [Scytonema sp. NUACC21]